MRQSESPHMTEYAQSVLGIWCRFGFRVHLELKKTLFVVVLQTHVVRATMIMTALGIKNSL